MSTILGEKDYQETKVLIFDFSAEMEEGETIASLTREVDVLQGADPLPDQVFSGDPTIAGQVAYQRMSGGVVGTQYHFRGRAVGNAGLAHVVSGTVRVVRF